MALVYNRQEKTFQYINNFLLFIVLCLCAYPFFSIVAKSFSSEAEVVAGNVYLIPKGWNVKAYEVVLGSQRFGDALGVTVYVTLLGTFINILLTIFVAYAVSRKKLKGANLITFLYVFTMLFSGGLIPTYLVVKSMNMINTLWALIIPGAVVPFNMFILRNYFYNISDSLEESAKLDGASNIRTLFSIMIPLAMPSIATICLFCAVGYWNSYFEALIYITDRSKYTLQVFLREIVIDPDTDVNNADLMMDVAEQSVRGATVVASTLPILIVYPFLQRYFVKGVMVGSVKE